MKKIIFVVLLCFFQLSLFAETITFSADSMTGQTGDSSTTSLNGHAYVKTDSMEISADKIELAGDDYDKIIAEGNISGKNIESQLEFTCETMEYDRNTKVALLKGTVNLVDVENDVKASAQIIEYNQDTNIAVLQIQVNLKQKDNVCTGAYAVYQKEAQILDISGNAIVKQGKDTFRAQQITFNLKTEDITLAGNVKGTVTDESKKKSEPAKTDSGTKADEKNQTEPEKKPEPEEKMTEEKVSEEKTEG